MNYLVTGCSRGVGLEICRVLLEQGHTVYGVARSYTDEFKKLESEFDNKLFFKSIDLGDSENVHRNVFKDFVNNRIQLHGYVNNAAMAYDDIVTNLKLDRLQSMYSVNVFTPMMITKYVLRNMLLHHTKGSIVHISSISAHTGYKGLAMYASSKGALEAFSKNTAREWGELGIRSNVVVPGFMETAMSATLTEEQKNRIYKRTSMKAAISVRSVAETVAFLLSDGACSITGVEIGVDVRTAKRAGLLHDIGKSVDQEMEGTHVQIGADLCRKYKESQVVINAVEAHHGDVEPESLIACIVQAADTISAARPGARRETLETYTNRLKQLEDISNSFKGVEKSFAIQAGREVRVMVVPDKISDDDMVLLARDISKQIEEELKYPGQIKVNVIRESRVTDYAK